MAGVQKMVDALDTIKTILTDNWNSDNTDSITPTIDFIQNHKELDMANKDYVLIYEVNESHAPFGIGGTTFAQENSVSIDIRTTYKTADITAVRGHLIKIKDEVLRIVKANLDTPDSNFKLLLPKFRKDFSDKATGMGRMVIDVTLKRWGS